jgi:DNA-binding NarL/FixJ family response regulator
MAQIRIIVVDDHEGIRENLAFLLSIHDDFQVVGLAENGAAAVEKAAALQPDVILMDYAMPQVDGVDAIRHVVELCPTVRVIGYSWHDEETVGHSMLEAGAVAFVRKGKDLKGLIHAIREAAKQESV